MRDTKVKVGGHRGRFRFSPNPGDAVLDRINVSEDYEVRFWAKALGISEVALMEAVSLVGDKVDDVRAYVNLH